jgi:hypothetical protein
MGGCFRLAEFDATLEERLALEMGVLAPLAARLAAARCVVLLRREFVNDAGEAALEEDLEDGVRDRSLFLPPEAGPLLSVRYFGFCTGVRVLGVVVGVATFFLAAALELVLLSASACSSASRALVVLDRRLVDLELIFCDLMSKYQVPELLGANCVIDALACVNASTGDDVNNKSSNDFT